MYHQFKKFHQDTLIFAKVLKHLLKLIHEPNSFSTQCIKNSYSNTKHTLATGLAVFLQHVQEKPSKNIKFCLKNFLFEYKYEEKRTNNLKDLIKELNLTEYNYKFQT